MDFSKIGILVCNLKWSPKPFQHHMKVYGLLNHQKSTKMASPSCDDFAKSRKVSPQRL